MSLDRKPLEGRWLMRAGQDMWRVLGVHVNNDHANKRREDCRKTMADLTGLALRDKVDIMTGDFNQAGGYLEECVFHAVKYHERQYGLEPGTIQWKIPGETCEIRTVFFNWPVDGVEHEMFVKEQTVFRELSVQDFGLKVTDTDAHVPQFS